MLRSTNLLRGVRIGCSSGFWGDTNTSAAQLVNHGKIDYLVGDYLSEITMSLLAKAQSKKPDLGFTPDFVKHVAPLLHKIKDENIKVVSNAGGMNPVACAKMLQAAAAKQGVTDFKIAVITGDDLRQNDEEFEDTVSANAYIGAKAIAYALEKGAQFVITGRCVDSALVLGPLVKEYNWSWTDYDKLSSGSLAGHVIECGAQATGGIFTDWKTVSDGYHNIGFPIVDCEADGSFTVSKPPATGGIVNRGTISEQIVYEIGDPKAYLLPDVSCDWSHVSIEEVGEDQVAVSGAKGNAPPEFLKASITRQAGYRLTSVVVIFGGEAVEKGVRTAEAMFRRVENLLDTGFTRKVIHPIGGDFMKTGRNGNNSDRAEAAIWIAAEHSDVKALQLLATEIAPAGTGMAPGFVSLVGGRPRLTPIFKLDPKCLVDRSRVEQKVSFSSVNLDENFTESESVCDDKSEVTVVVEGGSGSAPVVPESGLDKGRVYALEELAWLRSGDKGDHSNIGIVARKPEYFAALDTVLTEEFMKQQFRHLFDDKDNIKVDKFYLPGIYGMNFMLYNSLGGGGVASLRPDPQGKSYAQLLSNHKITA